MYDILSFLQSVTVDHGNGVTRLAVGPHQFAFCNVYFICGAIVANVSIFSFTSLCLLDSKPPMASTYSMSFSTKASDQRMPLFPYFGDFRQSMARINKMTERIHPC